MNPSILLVGSNSFQARVFGLVSSVTSFTIGAAHDSLEALPLIQAQQPDLLLIQSSQAGGLDLCRQVKQQSRLAWIYCIMVADQPADTRPDRDREIKDRIHALEHGADAYLWVPLGQQPDLNRAFLLQSQWLQAQVRTGLRQVRNHRELMRTNDVLSAIALSDPLTELNNRRAFEWELPRQIQNARARHAPISIIMLDVDHFKRVNDTHGHLVGDRALQLFATRLRYNLRFYDTPFRYGGEEFVVILNNTAGRETVAIAQRICQLISETPFIIHDKLALTLTVSAGTATLQASDDSAGVSLLQRADQGLLQAKAQGRNQIVGDSSCLEPAKCSTAHTPD